MSGPLAALSPVSMVANLAGGKGLLGKSKKKPAVVGGPTTETVVQTPGASPSRGGAGNISGM